MRNIRSADFNARSLSTDGGRVRGGICNFTESRLNYKAVKTAAHDTPLYNVREKDFGKPAARWSATPRFAPITYGGARGGGC